MGASSVEHPAQQPPRPEEVRLGRSGSDAKLLGDLGVLVPGDIVQHKHAAGTVGEPSNGCFEVEAQTDVGRGCGHIRDGRGVCFARPCA